MNYRRWQAGQFYVIRLVIVTKKGKKKENEWYGETCSLRVICTRVGYERVRESGEGEILTIEALSPRRCPVRVTHNMLKPPSQRSINAPVSTMAVVADSSLVSHQK